MGDKGYDRRLAIIEAILDLDPGSHEQCRGEPLECSPECPEESCPLRHNRLQQFGSLVLTLIEEHRWHRAYLDELEHLGMLPLKTRNRIALRVHKSRLEDALEDTRARLQDVGTVQALRDEVERRVQEIQAEIEAVTLQIEEP